MDTTKIEQLISYQYFFSFILIKEASNDSCGDIIEGEHTGTILHTEVCRWYKT